MAARRRNPTAAKRRKKDAEQGQDTQCKKLEPEVLPDARPFGTLSVMPLEILFNIMSASRLDVPTLASCRCVCRAAKSVVDTGILEYKWLASHHLNVIHAMINADARHPTCAAVCATLRLEQCSFCSRKIRYRPHAAGPLMSACLYLPTAELLCTTCYSNRSGDLIPYCETHLQKHLSDVRKDLGKRGEDQAVVDWSRAHLVPSAQGLLQTSRVNGRVYHQRGWLRPVLYDARAVEQVFGLKLERYIKPIISCFEVFLRMYMKIVANRLTALSVLQMFHGDVGAIGGATWLTRA